MTQEIRERSLKCIIAAASPRALEDLVAPIDHAHLDFSDRRILSRDAMVVHSSATPEQIRDALMPLLDLGASLVVVEFERWSSYGVEVDVEWLLRRGH